MRSRVRLFTLVMISLFILVACNKPSEKPTSVNEFLITEGVALTCEMDELAESKEYIALMTSSESIGKITDTIASQDYGIPGNAYLIKLSDRMILQALSAYSENINLPDSVMKKMKHKINGSVYANMINATHGSEIIATTSILTWGKSYLQPKGWSENIILLLEYPGEFSSAVSFVQSGDGVISGSSVFVKNSDKDLLKLFGEFLNIDDIQYDQFSSSQLQSILKE